MKKMKINASGGEGAQDHVEDDEDDLVDSEVERAGV
jgi:hypothetical protein